MRRALAAVLCLSALGLAARAPAARAAGPAGPAVLVLHDSGGDWGGLGAEYALMVRNLLGHFDASVTTKPVTQYRAGEIGSYRATFYIGSTFDEPDSWAAGSAEREAYSQFLADAASPEAPLVWIGDNMWHLAWEWDPSWGESFSARFGLDYLGNDFAGLYNRVTYKQTTLLKGVVTHANPGADLNVCIPETEGEMYDCSTSLGYMRVVDPSKATVLATAGSTMTASTAPYVVRSGNLWYVADIPLTYLSDEDRYLAFADLLHDMLGIFHATQHRALVRLEDVHPAYDVAQLDAVAASLKKMRAPYSLAVIPIYKDPFGALNGGVPKTVKLAGSSVARALARYVRDGATIVQHGTTHQADFGRNPYTGVSGDDFEFYTVVEQDDHSLAFTQPVPGDSEAWAASRIEEGRQQLIKAKVPAFGFEPPHYLASAADYRAMKSIYPVQYARVVYYPTQSTSVGQFYPFTTTDAYGFKVVPEDIGNIEPADFNGFAMSFPEDLIRRAKAALVVRDGFASFFYHPFLGTAMLEQTVRGIQALGYTFVRACEVAGSCM
jgi:uncharacterized protein YdaL